MVYPDATTEIAAIVKERKDAIGQLLRTGNATRSLRSHLQKLQAVQ
jgi:hypothetical protein